MYELPWNGEPFAAKLLAIDCETDARTDPNRTVQDIVLATVSDGHRSAVLAPWQLPQFILSHTDCEFVGHNFAFDFWVIDAFLIDFAQQLCDAGTGCAFLLPQEARDAWWQLVENNRVHDTMLLDMLLRLAEGAGESGADDEKLYARGLGRLATAYAKHIEVDKGSDYRLRFHEILDPATWATADPGFFQYAINDTLATALIYRALRQQADHHILANRIPSDKTLEYGPLTESIQVKASIALAKASRLGLPLDQEGILLYEQGLRQEYEEAIVFLTRNFPKLFKTYKRTGAYKYAAKSGAIQMFRKELMGYLEGEVAAAIRTQLPHFIVPLSKGKMGLVSTSADDWVPFEDFHPFIKAWLHVASLVKQLSFIDVFKEVARLGHERIHSRYNTLVRTGRTSNQDPNTQQFPRKKAFRQLIKASPEYKLYRVDYSFIELRTLAAICEKRYGWSYLANTIREGKDPHCHTGGMFVGLTYEQMEFYSKLPKDDPRCSTDEGKLALKSRQDAKAVNFGVPGGLSAPRLVEYARATYGVSLTLEQATTFRDKLITEVYPELKLYLNDTSAHDIGLNLNLSPEIVEDLADRYFPGNTGMCFFCAGQVARGQAVRKDGVPYKPRFQSQLWAFLGELVALGNAEEELQQAIKQKEGSRQLYNRIFASTAVTLTGRIRSKCRYTVARNTPFQGLAADGGKLALWVLTKQGYRVIMFVHDEIVIELPVDTADDHIERIDRVLIDEMEGVLEGRIPVAVEGVLSQSWSK